MKKSTIWLLTIVMASAILGLLYVQIMYMENMIKMRNEQFSETVMRSLYGVSTALEQDETRYYLNKDLKEVDPTFTGIGDTSITPSLGVSGNIGNDLLTDKELLDFNGQYQTKQDILKGQYLYQRGLLNEVILSIMNQSSDRPIDERADSLVVNSYLKHELENNGLELPYQFAIVNRAGDSVYSTITPENAEKESFSQTLFPNDPVDKQHTLKIVFPTKNKYIFSSVKYMIPSFIFTLLLIFIFIYTVIVAFRQKRISEIKNDFINNMTHEFKTPISTISLAAQMLNDDSVRKSPTMMKHVSTVINDETKRLRFQVEKVLQMSMFDNKNATMRLQDADANAIIDNVVNTYKIKVERFGGKIESNLDAPDAIVNVDEMHFTNVIFNLLDNAIKYRRDDVEPMLSIATRNPDEEHLEITITDNGIGIKKEDLKKIFDKFYRVSTGNRHDVKGFGLGLAYVYKMITLFKGTIKAESELNIGSKFIINLPLYK